jgi:hypothetical protein
MEFPFCVLEYFLPSKVPSRADPDTFSRRSASTVTTMGQANSTAPGNYTFTSAERQTRLHARLRMRIFLRASAPPHAHAMAHAHAFGCFYTTPKKVCPHQNHCRLSPRLPLRSCMLPHETFARTSDTIRAHVRGLRPHRRALRVCGAPSLSTPECALMLPAQHHPSSV